MFFIPNITTLYFWVTVPGRGAAHGRSGGRGGGGEEACTIIVRGLEDGFL